MSLIVSPTSGVSVNSIGVDDIIEALFYRYAELTGNDNDNNDGIIAKLQLPSLRSLPLMSYLLPNIDEKKFAINKLLQEQKRASNYKKWYEISLQLDELMNNNSWKSNPQSDLYDYNLIYNNLNEMKNARLNKDYKLLLYYIRTKWIRNLGNMGDVNLYRHSFTGTKKIIEEYIEECKTSLNYLLNDPDVNLDDRYLLGMLIQTRKNIGRTALVLSGGSTFGIFHIGVLATLFECNLLPRIISGSSAGSIMASILCCHSNEEIIEILSTIADREFKIFGSDGNDPNQSQFRKVLGNLSHFIKYGTFFDITDLKQTMLGFLGDLTFREAYNRSGKILNITVSPTSIHESTRLLNYLTAPHCLIWSAVCASCSLPGVFPSTSIYEKNPRTGEIREWNSDTSAKYVDGSVDNDLPITRLSEMFNVDHIIAVQVNPHVVPILKAAVTKVGGDIENELSNKLKTAVSNTYDFLSCEVIHYLQMLNEMDICKNLATKLISVLTQSYSGDITILPDFKSQDFLKLFDDPTPEFMLDFILRGAKASWPKITVIHNHCGVEFTLDNCIGLLRGRIITSANNRITYEKPHDSHDINGSHNPDRKSVKRGKSTIGLVSSPVMITDKSFSTSTPNTPEKPKANIKFPTEIRRHNSANVPIRKMVNKKKSNSISTPQENSSRFPQRKSTTSLASLSYDFFNRNVSAESTLINDSEADEHKHSIPNINVTLPNSIIDSNNSNKEYEDRKKIRKARSSTNFRTRKISSSNDLSSLSFSHDIETEKIKYQSERVPCADTNPYVDKSPEREWGPVNKTDRKEKEKANLPKVSASTPKPNSYIGLNRLKGTDLSRSGNNSINDLRNFINQDQAPMPVRLKDLEKKVTRFDEASFDHEILHSDDDSAAFRLDTNGNSNGNGTSNVDDYGEEEFLGDDEASNPVDDDEYDNEVRDYYELSPLAGEIEDEGGDEVDYEVDEEEYDINEDTNV
ncbi:acyl transferase/acyl hydrolase/lysophospholipase [Scheffersomyces amazonensis]|uniref:acyl transferase/acyl hydrolase/lysophospholipase n=1 Tax=Scheffersomyces amazonensis TaxID=1078765 RepID=UPI00315D5A2D